MDLKVFSHHELEAVLRALLAVAVANDNFSDVERDFVETIAQIHEAVIDVDALEPITVEEVARIVVDPHRRKRAVQLAIVMALVEGEPSESTEHAVRELARALEIPEPGLEVLYEMSHGHTMLARFEMLRRMRSNVQKTEGFPGFFKLALGALGLGDNAAVAARYRQLEKAPEGSFGRALYLHYVDNGFPLPGEKQGLPEAMVFHDVGHVLSGYGVDPQGEIQQAAFQAGFRREDGFLFLLFGVLQFHLGLRITPIAKGQRGLFDVRRVLRAAQRGAACKLDLGNGFDVFAYAETPLEHLRAELGIPALSA